MKWLKCLDSGAAAVQASSTRHPCLSPGLANRQCWGGLLLGAVILFGVWWLASFLQWAMLRIAQQARVDAARRARTHTLSHLSLRW